MLAANRHTLKSISVSRQHFRGPHKTFNIQVLLGPLEKQLNLPALLIYIRNHFSTQAKVIGEKYVVLACLSVNRGHHTYFYAQCLSAQPGATGDGYVLTEGGLGTSVNVRSLWSQVFQ